MRVPREELICQLVTRVRQFTLLGIHVHWFPAHPLTVLAVCAGIFSPVESTPHPVLVGGSSDGNSTSGGSKATAAIPPTQRPQQTDGRPPQDVRSGYRLDCALMLLVQCILPSVCLQGISSDVHIYSFNTCHTATTWCV